MSAQDNIVCSKLESFAVPNISVGELLKNKISEIIQNEPNRKALIDAETDISYTYSDVDQKCEELAFALAQSGITKEDIVAFYGDNCTEYYYLLLAVYYLGVTTTPVTPANGAFETFHQLNSCQAKVLFVSIRKFPVIEQMLKDLKYFQVISNLKLMVLMDCEQAPAILKDHPNRPKSVMTFQQLSTTGTSHHLVNVPYFPIDPEKDKFIILYTSGTTGLPKGAVHNHKSVVASEKNLCQIEIFKRNYGKTINFIFPFGHVSGSFFMMREILNNTTVVLFGNVVTEQMLEGVSKYQCRLIGLFPAMAVDLYKNSSYYRQKYDLSCVKSIFVTGCKFPKEVTLGLRDNFSAYVHELYGATEFMGCVGCRPEQYIPGNVGSPLANVEMKIVSVDDGRSLPAYQEGEICFRGPNCFLGYLDNEEATQRTIDKQNWYHTGDVGFFDEDNCLHITDRIKEMIKYKQWSIGPSEIENFLESHESVLGACVVGVKHQTEGYHLRAFVELRPGMTAEEKDLIKYVQNNMGYQKRLNGGVKIVESLPRSSMGKIQRQHYKKMVENEILTKPATVE